MDSRAARCSVREDTTDDGAPILEWLARGLMRTFGAAGDLVVAHACATARLLYCRERRGGKKRKLANREWRAHQRAVRARMRLMSAPPPAAVCSKSGSWGTEIFKVYWLGAITGCVLELHENYCICTGWVIVFTTLRLTLNLIWS